MNLPNLLEDAPVRIHHRKSGEAYRYLVEKQTLIARSKGLSLTGSAKDGHGEPRYHHLVDTNVFHWDQHALRDFKRGQGNESDNKIKCCHSSSALACSLFNIFRSDPAPLCRALGIPFSPLPSLTLERILPVLPDGGFGGCPNYDCTLETSKSIYAIEVKYSEWASPRPHPPLKPKYVLCPSIWDGLPRLKELARELVECDPWTYLDGPQLCRHMLGIALTQKPDYQLIYLYVDTHHEEARRHREEIADFHSRLDDPSRFQSVTVQDLILKVADLDYPGNASWVNFMSRYL